MKNKQNLKIRSSMGILGLLGCLGFIAIAFKEPTFFTFFGFFGFFSWYWYGKLDLEKSDERLVANQLRATNTATRVTFGFVFAGMIISGNYIESVEIAYSVLICIVSLGFAAALNLTAYLTWKYEQEN